MRLRYPVALAVLALAGCALPAAKPSPTASIMLVPPIGADGKVDTSQPLSKWQDVEDFATPTDCNASLTRQQSAAHTAFGPVTSASAKSADQVHALQTLKGQCVARDDPRLAK